VKLIGETPSAASKNVERYFDRTNTDSLVLTSFYTDTFINNPKVKLQKLFTHAANAFANDKHLSTLAQSTLSQSLASDEDLDDSDVIAGFTRSMFSSVFHAHLKYPRNRMAPFRFATWVRFFLKLPQPPHLHAGNLQPRVGELSYAAEACLGHHAKGIDRLLDLHANHACGRCVSSFAGMSERHSNVKWCLHNFSKEAGLESKVEPATHDLLNRGSYEYTPDDVRHMFPKGSTKKHQAYSSELQESHAAALQMQPGQERTVLESRCQVLKKLIEQIDNNKGSYRVDIEIRDTHDGQDRWVDTTIIHPTCKSHKKAELKKTTTMEEFRRVLEISMVAEEANGREEKREEKREYKNKNRTKTKQKEKKKDSKIKEEIKEESKREDKEGQDEGKREQPGNTVAKQEQLKMQTYAPLVRIATEQYEKGKREVLPVFHPFVLSTLGEEGPLAVSLREWIVMAYARKLEREGPRDDGRSIQHLTADFRSRMRCSLHIAVAKGLARQISSAGFPSTSCAKHTG
jgi:hypothetical protein